MCLWDTDTGKSVSIVRAPRNLVTELEWIGCEMAVLQSSEDKILRVWDLRACSMSQQFRVRNYMQVNGEGGRERGKGGREGRKEGERA